MAKHGIKGVEPEVEVAMMPTTSKKRKTSGNQNAVASVRETRVHEQAAPRQELMDVNGSLAVEKLHTAGKIVAAKKPALSKKRKSAKADDDSKVLKATKKGKVSATKEQAIIPDVPIIHDDYKKWNVLSMIGRVTNAQFNSAWPIYCYELEGEFPRWSWDLAGSFKNPKAIKKVQEKFDRTHRLGTARLKEGSDELEEACRQYAIAPPTASGAPTIGLRNLNQSNFAWFGPDGYMTEDPTATTVVVSPSSSKIDPEVESRPKATMKEARKPMKKKRVLKSLATSPDENPGTDSCHKTSTKKNKTDDMSPLRTTAVDISKEEKDGMSLRQRIIRLPPVQAPVAELSLKDRLVWQYRNSKLPEEATSDFMFLVTKSRNEMHRVRLDQDTCTQTIIVGLYRRRLSPAIDRQPRTATYTSIYTRDSRAVVQEQEVAWFEHDRQQVYLIDCIQTSPDGKQKLFQGFAPIEHLERLVDYQPQIEEFEVESMGAVYAKKDKAARLKQVIAEKKRFGAEKKFDEQRQRGLLEEAEELRLR